MYNIKVIVTYNLYKSFSVNTRKVITIILFFLFTSVNIYGQSKLSFKGQVVDEQNNPLIGANVILDNINNATITDNNGVFNLENLKYKVYQLEISYLGYKKYSKTISQDEIKSFNTFKLFPEKEYLPEVIVNCDYKKTIKKNESVNIEIIDKKFIEQNNSGSLMQTLKKLPGISANEIGSGMSKPVIRGLSYNRVVVAEGGIKQEGQQWSAHHGLEIDQFDVQKVEIIKGPASLKYGSDAIGGIINILPASFPLKNTLEANLTFLGKSNNEWLGTSAMFAVREEDYFVRGRYTYHNFGDYRVPAETFEYKVNHYEELGGSLINTAGRENAVSLTAGTIKSWGNSYITFSNFSHKAGFFAMSSGQELINFNLEEHQQSNRDIKIPYQNVVHQKIQHHTNIFINENKLEIALGFQNNLTQEYALLTDLSGNRFDDYQKFKDSGLDLQYCIKTYSANVLYDIRSVEKHTFSLGVNSQYQQNEIDGFNFFIPNYNRALIGGYLSNKYEISKKLLVNIGVRLDHGIIELKETLNPDPELGDSIFNPDYLNTYTSYSYSAGLNYNPKTDISFKVNIGKSFRMPTAKELGSYGIHSHAMRFEKGDINIKPEQAYQLDLGFELDKKRFSFEITPFINYFTNYIYLTPTPEYVKETFTGQVYEYRQNQVLRYGGEIQSKFDISSKLSIHTNAEYVYAVNLDLLSAIPFTPPLTTLTGIEYRLKDNEKFKDIFFSVDLDWSASQKYTAVNELSTPQHKLINLSSGAKITLGKQIVNVVFQVNNLFNTKHFDHLNYYRRLQIPEQGRNFQILITIPINKKLKIITKNKSIKNKLR